MLVIKILVSLLIGRSAGWFRPKFLNNESQWRALPDSHKICTQVSCGVKPGDLPVKLPETILLSV